MTETVSLTVRNNLCISCGLCAAVCPGKCITFREDRGHVLPSIHEAECLHCGKCLKVCPGKGFDYAAYGERFGAEFHFRGVKEIYTVRAKDEYILRNAVSGGFVTGLISGLLAGGDYKHAFVVRGHSYESQPQSEIISSPSELHDSQKSRYVIVSHRQCAEYLLSHPEEKIILVGTSCFVHGIMNLVSGFGLKRGNYFIIGLFCDRTMSMNVIRWFRNHRALTCGMKELYFRTKDSGGWPGGVRLVQDDGKIIDLPNTERMKVKDYFQPERCLYCLDKLNIFADISAGDNYTGKHSDSKGSSSIIIRTEEGLRVWRMFCEGFEAHEASREEIGASQGIGARVENYFFAKLKEQETGRVINVIDFVSNRDCGELQGRYRGRLRVLRAGERYAGRPTWIRWDMFRRKLVSVVPGVLRKIRGVMRSL